MSALSDQALGAGRQALAGHPEEDMKNICWTLIGLGGLAFVVGAILAFTNRAFLLAPQGYWRGAVGFAIFAIALRLMEERRG